LPLMITCISATLLATQLQRASIYTLKLLRRGVDIHRGQTVNVLHDLSCQDVIRDDFESVEPSASVVSVISSFMDHPGSSVFVVDGEERLLGVITIDDVRPLMADVAALGTVVIAGDMMRETGYPVLHPDDSLDEIMQRFGSYQYTCPVIDEGRLVGAVWPMDVIERYNAEIFKREMASSMSLAVSNGVRVQAVPGVHGMSLADLPVPSAFIGKALRDLELRRDFDLTVLLIKRRAEGSEKIVEGVPEAESVLEADDILLALGTEDGIRRFEQMR
jgi:CBS domain-containing protein